MSDSEIASPEFIQRTLDILRDEGVPETLIQNMEKLIAGEKKLTKKQIQYFADEVFINFERSIITPGEPVGTVAAQSIGEPGTQMSIAGNERVIISVDNIPQIHQIGKIVDNFFNDYSADVYRIGDSEVLDLSEGIDIKVPSINDQEKLVWKNVKQFSRHSPNGKLLKITTRTGRKILATPSHSFLIRSNNEIISIKGDDLSIDDRIPIMKEMQTESEGMELNLKNLLPPSKFWYGSEVDKAKNIYNTAGRNWKQYHNVEYTTPVQCDEMRNVFKGETMAQMESGYVYPAGGQISDVRIPETMTLNESFGYFIGAYLAEGSLTPSFVSIANVDENFIQNLEQFASQIGTKIYQRAKDGEFGPSISNNISSSVLSKLVKKLCGSGSANKFIDYHFLFGNEIFASALLRGYFDGDGSISVEREMIRASSNSYLLIEGISLILTRFGIFSKISRNKNQWTLTISKQYIEQFYNSIGFEIKDKQNKLKDLVENIKYDESIGKSYDSVDMIPGFGTILSDLRVKLGMTKTTDEVLCANIRKWTRKQTIGRRTLADLINGMKLRSQRDSVDISHELSVLINAIESPFLWDKITSIENINCPTEYVYDFSVNDTENFMLANGILTHNTLRTFHFAGVSEFSVTQGLPRLIEIVDARRNPTTPIMYIFLEKPYSEDREKAKEVHHEIEQIRVDSIAYDVEIDLSDYSIVIYLEMELLEDKGIDIEDLPKKLKKFKKKGTIEVDYDNNLIVINPEIDDVQKLQKMREKILTTLISGIKGVKRGIIYKDHDIDEYMIQCEGTNLFEVLKIEGVDKVRTISNHIHEVEKLFGIEAARELIIRESKKVLEDQGLDVDQRHLLTMADLMCYTGRILQIGRHGISGVKESILARAAFEVTIKQLLNASITGEEEKLRGIPENVIIGQLVPTIGTGAVNLQADLERYVEILKEKSEESDE